MGEDAITLPEKMLELCKHHDKKDSVLLPGDSYIPLIMHAMACCQDCQLSLQISLHSTSRLMPQYSPQTSAKLGTMVRQDMEELAGDVMGRMLSFPPPEHHSPDVRGSSKIIFSTQNPGNTKI